MPKLKNEKLPTAKVGGQTLAISVHEMASGFAYTVQDESDQVLEHGRVSRAGQFLRQGGYRTALPSEVRLAVLGQCHKALGDHSKAKGISEALKGAARAMQANIKRQTDKVAAREAKGDAKTKGGKLLSENAEAGPPKPIKLTKADREAVEAQWTAEELHAAAAEFDIEGRSNMNKGALIDALCAAGVELPIADESGG